MRRCKGSQSKRRGSGSLSSDALCPHCQRPSFPNQSFTVPLTCPSPNPGNSPGSPEHDPLRSSRVSRAEERCVGVQPNLEEEGGQVALETVRAQGPDDNQPDPYEPQKAAAGVASSEAECPGASYFTFLTLSLSPFGLGPHSFPTSPSPHLKTPEGNFSLAPQFKLSCSSVAANLLSLATRFQP